MYKTHTISHKEYRGVIISMTPRLRLYWLIAFITLITTIILSSQALAIVTSDISKFYKTDSTINSGSIVAVKADKADFVELASKDSQTDILGVAVGSGNSTLEINNSNNGVNVAIGGRTEVSIKASSNSIERGDYIGVGADNGIGDVVSIGQKTVGIAEVSSKELPEVDGIKKLPILVMPGVAPGEKSVSFVASIAGRKVSGLQVFFSSIIGICGLAAIGFLSYSAVRNGLFAIGRNPLAKPAILGGLMQVMFMVSLIALVCVGLMYVTLRI